MRAAGFSLLEWQERVITDWLARDETGHWAAGTLGISVPRQNGKTDGCNIPLMAYRPLVFGEWVVYTAHLQKTATETFEALRDLFDTPELKPYLKDVKGAIGREEINLRNGGRVKFLARTRNGGRGQHGDLLIFDEAQALTSAQQASFLPVISASKNPQTVYSGTPPSPDDDGGVFAGIRARAMSGEATRTVWLEWGIQDPSEAGDRASWYKTNPSLGLLIQESTIVTEWESMAEDEFARERLGWWTPRETQEPPAIDPAEWDACEVEDPGKPSPDERVACGVKFSPDGTTYSVSFAARQDDRPVLVECYDRAFTTHGIGGLADALLKRKDDLALVALDGREWTPTLSQRLLDLGFPKRGIHVMKVGEVADACAMLSGAVADRTLAHVAQPLLRQSIATSPRRQIGRDGWGFGGDDPTPAESAALAHWAVVTSRRNPKRKLRVGI